MKSSWVRLKYGSAKRGQGKKNSPTSFISCRLYQGLIIASSIGTIGKQQGRNRHNHYLRV